MQDVAESICDFYTNLYESDHVLDQKLIRQNRALKLENDALYHLFKNGTKKYQIIEHENERIVKLIDECLGKLPKRRNSPGEVFPGIQPKIGV